MASGTAVGNPCQGAGFGCFPAERAGIEFLVFLIGLPATIVWCVLGLIVTSLVDRMKNLNWWWRLLLGICLALFALMTTVIIQVR